MTASSLQSITVLGATGSIGVSTLDVLSRHPDRYCVYALTAHTQVELLASQCRQFHPQFAVVADEASAEQLKAVISNLNTEVLWGANALVDVASADEVDVVMAAIVGAAGLLPTLAAAESGKRVLLANKESLVMAGGLFLKAVEQGGAQLLPIDSEHNAIFQCLPDLFQHRKQHGPEMGGVAKILLTGSGGPFRTSPLDSLAAMTPDQACAHPNWSMGRKISVDSATMMNKGLELIEACLLFNLPVEQVDVVIHPQSVIHSMVEYIDGSVLAQLGNPDMRTPIAHALAWPERISSGVSSLDIIAAGQLDFEAPDYQRFPCLRLAQEAARQGGDLPTALNAANEVAVAAFLSGDLGFTRIAEVVDCVLQRWQRSEPDQLSVVQAADNLARRMAMDALAK